jgi:hypothetical protein
LKSTFCTESEEESEEETKPHVKGRAEEGEEEEEVRLISTRFVFY